MRTSSYIIYVPLPNSEEKLLLVHGFTGAYDKVSVEVASYLRSLQKKPPTPLYGTWSEETLTSEEAFTQSTETIKVLKRRGYLTDMTVEQEEEFFAEIAKKLHHMQSLFMPHYVLMPTYDCNLRCSYCFQDHMRTNPAYSHLLRTMQPEIVDRIFAVMPQIEAGHGVPSDSNLPRQITLFGGEPLRAENRFIIEYIVDKATALGKANFFAVTNGTELDTYQSLLGPEKISAIQITLDGPSSEHDQRRIYPDGQGSFEVIARNISMALNLGVQVNVRMNIDRNNIHKLPELADEIVARGWNKDTNFSGYTAPVHATNQKTDLKTTFNSWQLRQEITKMRQAYPNMTVISRPDDKQMNGVKQIFEPEKQSLPNLKASFCGAHNKMYVFDPFGDIYACWEKTGDKKIRIGHVTEDNVVILNEELNQTWRNRTVISNPVCRKCRYALYCGGGCAILAMTQKGEFHSNYCDGFGERLRATIAEAYLEHLSGTKSVVQQQSVCST